MGNLTIAINQTVYLPWKGFFDLIHDVDLFIFYDDVQYTRDWINRNKIKTQEGSRWISVPVNASRSSLICNVNVDYDQKWQEKHWKAIKLSYSNTPYFKKYKDFFEDVYMFRNWHSLHELNIYLITNIAKKFLNIKTKFEKSWNYDSNGCNKERIISLCHNIGATTYIAGLNSKNYITEKDFDDANINLIWKYYNDYPEYPQKYPPFNHNVTVLDLLFNTGDEAPYYIWGWRDDVRVYEK